MGSNSSKIEMKIMLKKGVVKMDKNMITAAYCGLFCESCTLYIGTKYDPKRIELLAIRRGKSLEDLHCAGCRSETLSYYCRDCKIKECIKNKALNFCSECSEYPCDILKEFQQEMPHRIELFDSLDYINNNGFECWCKKMHEDYSCEKCGTINSAYDFECRNCGNTPSNEYIKRNKIKILQGLKK